jgi:L-threonylcarbamoyladenylate synthase
VSGAIEPRVVHWPEEPSDQGALAAEAARILNDGGVVVFPTDTVYGIGAHAGRSEAIDRLYGVKRRPRTKQIALLVDDVDALEQLPEDVPAAARTLAKRYWPGALTLVLRGRDPGETIAFRQPDHVVPRALIRAVGWPLATTSANLSDHPSPRTAADVRAQIPTGYELLIDGGPCPGGTDSTVLDCTGGVIRLLRPGSLDLAEVEALVGPIERRGS